MKPLLQFIFSFKAKNIELLDKSLQSLIRNKEYNAEIVSQFKQEQQLMYQVKMPVSSLIAFKRNVDTLPGVEVFELFEYKEW